MRLTGSSLHWLIGGSELPKLSRRDAANALWQAAMSLSAWRRRREYRRELKRLLAIGPHLVVDIGLMPVHARREASKPFWRI